MIDNYLAAPCGPGYPLQVRPPANPPTAGFPFLSLAEFRILMKWWKTVVLQTKKLLNVFCIKRPKRILKQNFLKHESDPGLCA